MRGGWLAALGVGVLSAATARADPRAVCSAHRASSRVLVDPELDDLFQDEQLHLIRLGLVGQVHLEVELLRPRPLWFSESLDRESLDLALTWSADERQYRMEGRPVEDPRRLGLERLVLHGAADGEVVEVRARLQVVTAGSLTTVAGWMVGGERSRTATTLLGVIADDLTLSASGHCDVGR